MTALSKIGIIVCSQRIPRTCPEVAEFVKDTIKQGNADANLMTIDLAEWNLPLYNEPGIPAMISSEEQYKFPLTKLWSKEIQSYAAFIFVTPEYNYGYPASLKNAIDYLSL
ncbi:flavoprotein-like protein [Dipodascopsis uninucleata]